MSKKATTNPATVLGIGIGMGTKSTAGDWLEVYFPAPLLNPPPQRTAPIIELLGYRGGNQVVELDRAALGRLSPLEPGLAALTGSTQALVAVLLAEDLPPASVPEAYFKLHLLSHRLARPNTINLDGIFQVLPTVAWTNRGALEPGELPRSRRRAEHPLQVHSLDKFPRMTDYHCPSEVRIADASRVRLGAHLGPGTTVMHEGFVNFNAGTLGASMVEGRISAGVVLGAGTDLGGGASIMGTLSGGGDIRISVGENCLLGANSGLGIPLGDRCTLEAGLYLTAGAKVEVLDEAGTLIRVVKAAELARGSDLLFIRHSLSGAIQCRPNPRAPSLNPALHGNN